MFRFDPDEDQWTTVKPMHIRRLGVAVTVVNRLLYAIGGYDGVDRHSSVECYHPENNAWTMVAPLNVGRSGAGIYLFIIYRLHSINTISSIINKYR